MTAKEIADQCCRMILHEAKSFDPDRGVTKDSVMTELGTKREDFVFCHDDRSTNITVHRIHKS